jgi:hypothetical protein
MATAEIFLKTEPYHGFAAVLKRWTRRTEPLPAREVDDTRARRDFILEMMDTHPDAFASEETVRCCALYFSGRF